MKNRFLTRICVLGMATAMTVSCSDWLEATSSVEIEASDLLSTEDGFKDAVIGVYMELGSEDAYGKNFTWYANDLAAFPYVMQLFLDYQCWQNHQYEAVRTMNYIEKMWARSYKAIADVNEVLRYLEKQKELLSPIVYQLMKGEMLGIRAYVHFDLMRMFGLPDWTLNGEKYTIPYVLDYSKEQTAQRTYTETVKLLFADIREALQNLRNDPVTGKQDSLYYAEVNRDGFWNDRMKRMNYYAVEALAARAWLWEGSEAGLDSMAYYAGDIIENNPTQWVDLVNFANRTDDYRDWTFSTEHLFSLEVYGLTDLTENWLLNTNANSGIKLPQAVVTEGLFIPYEERIIQEAGWVYDPDDPTGGPDGDGWFWFDEIKETIVLPSASDVRYNALLIPADGGENYSCKKLYQSEGYSSEYRNRIPMIRISEVYYMMAEYYLRKGNTAEALKMLDVVREHRGITEKFVPEETEDAWEELALEYMREFISEGQWFYYLKRNNAVSPLEFFPLTPADLLYPYPTSERINGGRHQDV